jgi:hypothetical protein
MPPHTPDPITTLAPNEIFVFGSNLAGRHGKGAALVALKKLGAIRGQGAGPMGRSYGIPTKDAALRVLPLAELNPPSTTPARTLQPFSLQSFSLSPLRPRRLHARPDRLALRPRSPRESHPPSHLLGRPRVAPAPRPGPPDRAGPTGSPPPTTNSPAPAIRFCLQPLLISCRVI